eukprot:GHVS01080850.1.p1 GENE.GHVS01080850.1~~GHVS01080850.1.p1  ORF type:complete len:783 (-),score=120.73 GHVS01080850.1:318-2666(-)
MRQYITTTTTSLLTTHTYSIRSLAHISCSQLSTIHSTRSPVCHGRLPSCFVCEQKITDVPPAPTRIGTPLQFIFNDVCFLYRNYITSRRPYAQGSLLARYPSFGLLPLCTNNNNNNLFSYSTSCCAMPPPTTSPSSTSSPFPSSPPTSVHCHSSSSCSDVVESAFLAIPPDANIVSPPFSISHPSPLNLGPSVEMSYSADNNRITAKPKVLFIIGPTGVGKTQLGLDVCDYLNSLHLRPEIINADSMQVYRGHSIGSGQPSPPDMAKYPHHLFNVVDATQKDFSLNEFTSMATQTVSDVVSRGAFPVVVGGTPMYVQSMLMESFATSDIPSRLEYEAGVGSSQHHVDPDSMDAADAYRHLCSIDPERARQLHCKDTRRIRRSIQVFQTCGRAHSELIKQEQDRCSYESFRYQSCVLWLSCDRIELSDRHNARIKQMLKDGLIDELIKLKQQLLDTQLSPSPHLLSPSSPPASLPSLSSSCKVSDSPVVGRPSSALEWEGDGSSSTFDGALKGVEQSIAVRAFETFLSSPTVVEHIASHTSKPLDTPLFDYDQIGTMSRNLNSHQKAMKSNSPPSDAIHKPLTSSPYDWPPPVDGLTEADRAEGRKLTVGFCTDRFVSLCRQYGRRQELFIKSKFVIRQPRLPVYRIDTTDLSNWKEQVVSTAIELCSDFLNDVPLRDTHPLAAVHSLNDDHKEKREDALNRLAGVSGVVVCPDPLISDASSKYFCSRCEREVIGLTTFRAHLRSRAHKRSSKVVGRNPNTKHVPYVDTDQHKNKHSVDPLDA